MEFRYCDEGKANVSQRGDMSRRIVCSWRMEWQRSVECGEVQPKTEMLGSCCRHDLGTAAMALVCWMTSRTLLAVSIIIGNLCQVRKCTMWGRTGGVLSRRAGDEDTVWPRWAGVCMRSEG